MFLEQNYCYLSRSSPYGRSEFVQGFTFVHLALDLEG
ncbi:hypothetical protein Msil_3726 [Methylocella silvestris BL2]|uniref:Uncharacterized protein n=1 Tax=Methylocella silvestris (strain DSM 15510 / CIP 108128 / LMG 27833 / NCIMB 13906 / BL2) TaxID=395965 RepID=B8EJB6_METSB|nr:hypothetical protein Msil_3726 [Methylocella silvestris BL2]